MLPRGRHLRLLLSARSRKNRHGVFEPPKNTERNYAPENCRCEGFYSIRVECAREVSSVTFTLHCEQNGFPFSFIYLFISLFVKRLFVCRFGEGVLWRPRWFFFFPLFCLLLCHLLHLRQSGIDWSHLWITLIGLPLQWVALKRWTTVQSPHRALPFFLIPWAAKALCRLPNEVFKSATYIKTCYCVDGVCRCFSLFL